MKKFESAVPIASKMSKNSLKKKVISSPQVVDLQNIIVLKAEFGEVYEEVKTEYVSVIEDPHVLHTQDIQVEEVKLQDSKNNQVTQQCSEYHCDSCDDTFATKTALVVHRTEQSIRKTRAALRASKKKSVQKSFNDRFAEQRPKIQDRKIDKPKLILEIKDRTHGKATVESNDDVKEVDGMSLVTDPKKSVKLSVKKAKLMVNGPIQCHVCQKIFKKIKYLNVHLGVHEAPHICHICGARLTSGYYLKMHIRRHNKEFTHFCQICQKGFYLRANLNIHMSVHSELKPCICEICQKPFGNRIYLKNHMKLHDEPSKRKKFKCDLCNFETFYSYCFKEHKWTHTGEGQAACEVCGKIIRKQYMKTHIRIHTGEKPEMCEFCGKAFSARKYLVKHRRTHTGERPYHCKICEKNFTQRGTLTAHLRRHHLSK